MPYSKDIRCGQGWFKTNVNWFYNYLDEIDEEIVVKTSYKSPLENDPELIDFSASETEYHNTTLEEEIELRVNEFISWKVFDETRKKLDEEDLLPEFFEDEGIWKYVYHHICMLVRRKPTWYELRSTLPDDESDSE
jgi:hypothetical protein